VQAAEALSGGAAGVLLAEGGAGALLAEGGAVTMWVTVPDEHPATRASKASTRVFLVTASPDHLLTDVTAKLALRWAMLAARIANDTNTIPAMTAGNKRSRRVFAITNAPKASLD
jgi:hypothetical protein